MFKFLALVLILTVVVVSSYPATENASDQAAVKAEKLADEQANLGTKDLEASDGDSDLKGAETFGFGFYPVVSYNRGYGYGGYGRRWGYGHGYGYGGYGGGWGYNGYPGGYYW